MGFFGCEHPKRIYNKYLDRWLFVSCGKCNMCLAKRASSWTRRLNDEAKCHRYVIFATLTYNDRHLPVMYYYPDNGSFYDPRSKEAFFLENNKKLDYASIDYLKCFCNRLPVGSVVDCQRFIKRLRSRVFSNPSLEGRTVRYIRYFMVQEYGETCFRPHYHVLFFTDSKWFAENAQSVVSSCWTDDARSSCPDSLGDTTAENVRSSASSYVASYLNCFDNLPSVYQERFAKPFALYSKSPSIGSLVSGSEEIRHLFDCGSVTLSRQLGREREFHEVLIDKNLCNRLYPKFAGFDQVPDYVFSGLLDEYVQKIFGKDYASSRNGFKRLASQNTCVGDYVSKILEMDTEKQSASRYMFTTLNKIVHQSRIFQVSTSQYVSRIREFYKNKDQYLLNYQLSWEQEFSKNSPPSRLLHVDPEFLFVATEKPFNGDSVRSYCDRILKSYGTDFFQVSSSENSLDNIQEFRKDCSKSSYIVNDTKKKRAKFEYLNSDKFVYSNEYRDFLNKYHNGFYKCNERTPLS